MVIFKSLYTRNLVCTKAAVSYSLSSKEGCISAIRKTIESGTLKPRRNPIKYILFRKILSSDCCLLRLCIVCGENCVHHYPKLNIDFFFGFHSLSGPHLSLYTSLMHVP